MRRTYYAVKRSVRPLLCLFGKHDHKMGLTDRAGRPFACLWCRKGPSGRGGRP